MLFRDDAPIIEQSEANVFSPMTRGSQGSEVDGRCLEDTDNERRSGPNICGDGDMLSECQAVVSSRDDCAFHGPPPKRPVSTPQHREMGSVIGLNCVRLLIANASYEVQVSDTV